MSRSLFIILAMVLTLAGGNSVHAGQQIWYVNSPDHGQTYSYGSETKRAWTMLGPNRHLALYVTFSNEPFAEGANRRFDDFTFGFPQVVLGPGGNTFFYHASNGLNLPVARRETGLFGSEIKLLPTAYLVTKKKHGYLTLTLVISVAPFEENTDTEINISH